MGVVSWQYVLLRMMVVGMHFLSFGILAYGVYKFRETKKKSWLFLILMSVAVHVSWNTYWKAIFRLIFE